MDSSLELIDEGFYLDPLTNKTFYVKKMPKITLVPPWVKSKPAEWKRLDKKKEASKK